MGAPHYYITTPIYYVNDKPHIGHAYTSIACDVLARYKRLDGYEVKFLTGTDEHGQKVEKSAKAMNIPPQAFVDEVSEHFRALSPLLNLSNDDFIRTTQGRHIEAAQALWKRLEGRGHIYLDSYAGWYSVRDEAYYQESELIEKDGQKLAPTGAEVEWVEEPSYFFRLSEWQDKLLKFYEENPDFVLPDSRRNEVISFVKGGLKDLSISRTTFSWGVPVPGDEKHVMYVWLDALTNYLTATGFPDEKASDYQRFWPADLHMVGKDIIRFHAIYWPAFLMAAELPTPKRVFAHGWWTIEGEKMSKSLGNVVAPAHLVEKYGLDQTRYFLLREVPFGNDGNFSRAALVDRINSELANTIGNLAQRTLSMIQKNCEGRVPQCDKSKLTSEDNKLLDIVYVTREETPAEVRDKMQRCQFNDMIADIVRMAFDANAYIDQQAPWKLKKEDPQRMEAVLYNLAEVIRCIAIMLQPYVPDSASHLLDQLGVDKNKRSFSHLTQEFQLVSGDALPEPAPVFPRIVEDQAA